MCTLTTDDCDVESIDQVNVEAFVLFQKVTWSVHPVAMEGNGASSFRSPKVNGPLPLGPSTDGVLLMLPSTVNAN